MAEEVEEKKKRRRRRRRRKKMMRKEGVVGVIWREEGQLVRLACRPLPATKTTTTTRSQTEPRLVTLG